MSTKTPLIAALEQDRLQHCKNLATDLRSAANKGRSREMWKCTHGLIRTAGYRKKKYAATSIAPLRYNLQGEPLTTDEEWGDVKLDYFAKLERADTMNWEQLKDDYNAEVAELHPTFCTEVCPGTVNDGGIS